MNTQLDHFENALLTEIRQYVTDRSTATRPSVKQRGVRRVQEKARGRARPDPSGASS